MAEIVLDRALPVDLSLAGWPEAVRAVRAGQFDLVVDLQGLFRSALLGWLSGAAVRIGFANGRYIFDSVKGFTPLKRLVIPLAKTGWFVRSNGKDYRFSAGSKDLRRQRVTVGVANLSGPGPCRDFNNLIAVIMNYAEFVADELGDRPALRADVEEIRRAAERAATLTRQLLIFSRREVAHPEILDVNSIVGEMRKLLERTIGENIEIKRFARFEVGAE